MGNQPAFLNRIKPMGGDLQSNAVGKKRKIIFYGDSPTCATGFGQVSRNILPALHKTGRYEVDILGINYWGDPHPDYPQFKIWPMAINNQQDPYGRQRLQQHLHDPNLDFDILFFMQDTFILEFLPNLLTSLKSNGKKFKSVFYYPVDGIPKESWVQAADAVDYPVTYSQFAFDQSVSKVPSIGKKLRVMPHGVNPNVFHPVSEDEARRFRSQFFGAHADKFIFLNVNRNQQRKDIPATIRAFKQFKEQRPNSLLYLHMAARDQGWNLPEVIKAFGLDITQDVILPQNFSPSTGFPLPLVNMIYNACDAVVSTCVGEGWGLSWTEAMAVKKPVIFPKNTCLTEWITVENGFPYSSGGDMDHITILPNDNEIPRPTAHINDMVNQMLLVHDDVEERNKRAAAGYEMVTNKLIWDQHVNPQWVSLFDSIIEEMRGGVKIADSTSKPDLTKPVLKGELL